MQNVLLDYSNLTEEKITNIKTTFLENIQKINDTIVTIPNENLSWSNLFQPLIDFEDIYSDIHLLNMKEFYRDENIRELCSDIESDIDQFMIEQNMRKDVYEKFKYWFSKIYPTEKINFTDEQISFIEDVNISYKKMGLDLPEDKYEKVKEIKKKIEELCNDFSFNLSNENSRFTFTKEQLEGLSSNFLESHKKDDLYEVSLKYPDFLPIVDDCKVRETRKKLTYEYKRRCIDENSLIADKVFNLRKELASIFGFENYSDYKLQTNMADKTETVINFINELKTKIEPMIEQDLTILSNLAKEDNIDKLEPYDIAYYSRIYTDKQSGIEKEELKKFFPVQKVISGTLEIYQKLLNYKFKKITNMNHTFWDENVELFEVTDENNNEKGYFYLDLFPRDGKYSHAACFDFISKSSKTLPVAVMACNFPKDFLYFDDVETFFHEFGHVMHHISAKSTISDCTSFSCEMDFVETPSQMFEEWCYVKEPLQMMSEGLTDDIIEIIKKKRKLLNGWHYARQLSFCFLDMEIHSNKYNNNSNEIYHKYAKEICKINLMENTNEIASFGHLMGGYDAGYYGYLWSLVYAKDLFSKFEGKELDTTLGVKLRDEVLAYGSIRKSIDSIKIFLEREPNSDAFLKSI
jgi:Zn-dependent oligopeptidase